MKTFWPTLASILVTITAWAQGLAPANPSSPVNLAAAWLQINVHNSAKRADLEPKWTVILTSVKPCVKQIRPNCWEISFVSN